MSGRDDFAGALEAIMARKREELGGAPTPEELLAYREGRLDAAARESVEARMALYPEAARALADLAAFPDVEAGPETPELSEADIEARWQSFRPQLKDLPRSVPVVAPLAETPRRSPPSWRRPAMAEAAALLLAAGALLGFFAGRWSRTAPEPALRPALNPTIVELAPEGDDGARAAPVPAEMLPGSEELVLVLALPATPAFSNYAAEIVDAEGRSLWSGEGLHPTPLGTVQLSFPRATLGPGSYRIELSGLEAGRREGVGRYEVRVE